MTHWWKIVLRTGASLCKLQCQCLLQHRNILKLIKWLKLYTLSDNTRLSLPSTHDHVQPIDTFKVGPIVYSTEHLKLCKKNIVKCYCGSLLTKISGFAIASYEQFMTYTNNDGCPGMWMVIWIWMCGPTSFTLFPSADSFKKGCCQLQAKVCAQITG